MTYKLKLWEIKEVRTGRAITMRAKSRRSLEKRLGRKRADGVLIRQVGGARVSIIAIVALLCAVLLWVGTATIEAADTCKVEMPASNHDFLGQKGVWTRLGQRLTIPGRTVTAIGYHVRRVGNPTGDIILSIRDAGTDIAIFTTVWGDASELPEGGAQGYITVPLSPPVRIDGNVRICAEYYGGNETDYVVAGYFSGDKITGECYTNYQHYGVWHDIGEAEEGSYMYEYVCEENGSSGNISTRLIVLVALGGVWFVIGLTYFIRKRHRA